MCLYAPIKQGGVFCDNIHERRSATNHQASSPSSVLSVSVRASHFFFAHGTIQSVILIGWVAVTGTYGVFAICCCYYCLLQLLAIITPHTRSQQQRTKQNHVDVLSLSKLSSALLATVVYSRETRPCGVVGH